MFKKLIIEALEDRYNAQISEAEATLKIYLESRLAGATTNTISFSPMNLFLKMS